MNEQEKSKEKSNKNEFHNHDNLKGKLIIPAIVSLFVAILTVLVSNQIQKIYERPDIEVLGAIPIDLYDSSNPDTDNLEQPKFITHKLGFIFKVKNTSPTPSPVHVALLDGCTNINYMIADNFLPIDKRMSFEKYDPKKLFQKHAKTIQKIFSSAIVRQDSNIVIGYGQFTYVGVAFPIPNQWGFLSSQRTFNSISLNGICSEIKVSNPNPAIQQLFVIKTANKERAKDINPNIRNGQIRISLLIGGEAITVEPSDIKKMKYVPLEKWEDLSLSQLYENPDSEYIPLKTIQEPNQ